jgi:hypothetical protein
MSTTQIYSYNAHSYHNRHWRRSAVQSSHPHAPSPWHLNNKPFASSTHTFNHQGSCIESHRNQGGATVATPTNGTHLKHTMHTLNCDNHPRCKWPALDSMRDSHYWARVMLLAVRGCVGGTLTTQHRLDQPQSGNAVTHGPHMDIASTSVNPYI